MSTTSTESWAYRNATAPTPANGSPLSLPDVFRAMQSPYNDCVDEASKIAEYARRLRNFIDGVGVSVEAPAPWSEYPSIFPISATTELDRLASVLREARVTLETVLGDAAK